MTSIEIHVNSKEAKDKLLWLLKLNLGAYRDAYSFASEVDRSMSRKYGEIIQEKSVVTTQKWLMLDLISKLCISYSSAIEEIKECISVLENNLADSIVIPFDKQYLLQEASRGELLIPISRVQRWFYE